MLPWCAEKGLRYLKQLGVDVRSEFDNGCPPVVMNARGLHGGHVRIKADVSSQFLSAQAALFTAGTDGDDLRTKGGGGFELVLRSIARHDNDGLHSKRPRRISHALPMISAGIGDDSAAAFLFAQGSDLVIRAAQFESADGLQVFQF